MTEKSIVFNSEEVQAILANGKIQIQRVVKPQPVLRDGDDPCWSWRYGEKNPPQLSRWFDVESFGDTLSRYCPYGQPGDRLWVRETWATAIQYDNLAPSELPTGASLWWKAFASDIPMSIRNLGSRPGKWRPSVHMPHWASRITVEVVSVAVKQENGVWVWVGEFERTADS